MVQRQKSTAFPYPKELYRLWFEYLKVAIASKDPEIRSALDRSAAFYAPWGDVAGVKFDDWWSTHRDLFVEERAIREISGESFVREQETIYLAIPLNESVTDQLKKLKTVLTAAHAQVESQRKKLKNKTVVTGAFRPTEGAEPKLTPVREMLTVYRDVYMAHTPPLKGKALLDAIHAFYVGRKNKKHAKVPYALMTAARDSESTLRNVRRYIKKAHQVVLNTAGGEFPGKYE